MYNNFIGGIMKKSYLILLLTVLFLGGSVFADVVQTTRKINKPPVQTQQKNTGTNSPRVQSGSNVNKNAPQNKLVNNVKMCKPYSETMTFGMSGVDFDFNVKIDGWVGNKCILNFNAKSNGANSTFQQLYGVDASSAQIFTYAPKVRCGFTKQQLEYVGDSILQEKERNNGASRNMLKDPANIDISSFLNMSASDRRLMDVLLNDRACTILNMNELNNMMNGLLGL